MEIPNLNGKVIKWVEEIHNLSYDQEGIRIYFSDETFLDIIACSSQSSGYFDFKEGK
jgi:myo-inositol-hexaphosphate 3-phosphohydrolase